METTRQNFRLHLPGLLKVLAEHLYSNRQVAVRELLQNAHDNRTLPTLTVQRRRPHRIRGRRPPGRDGRGLTRETREQLALMAPDDTGAGTTVRKG